MKSVETYCDGFPIRTSLFFLRRLTVEACMQKHTINNMVVTYINYCPTSYIIYIIANNNHAPVITIHIFN